MPNFTNDPDAKILTILTILKARSWLLLSEKLQYRLSVDVDACCPLVVGLPTRGHILWAHPSTLPLSPCEKCSAPSAPPGLFACTCSQLQRQQRLLLRRPPHATPLRNVSSHPLLCRRDFGGDWQLLARVWFQSKCTGGGPRSALLPLALLAPSFPAHNPDSQSDLTTGLFFFFLHLPFAFQTFTTNALSGPLHRLFILEAGPPCCHWLLLCTAYLTLRATAVFICLPAIKNVAKAKPGGVVGRNKRGATLHEDSWEERSAHPALRHSSPTHFTAPLSACQRHIRPLTGYFNSVFSERETQSRGQEHWPQCHVLGFLLNVRFYNLNTRLGGEELSWETTQ